MQHGSFLSFSRSRFKILYEKIVDEYNQTNINALPNSIRLQCLQLCVMQDPTLYNAYTSYLTTQRTTKGHAWQPSYDEFYQCMRENADMLDAADQGKKSDNQFIPIVSLQY